MLISHNREKLINAIIYFCKETRVCNLNQITPKQARLNRPALPAKIRSICSPQPGLQSRLIGESLQEP
jgi:hypothetical protein